ncbi:MAG TPA: tetraacyldisaccharide 4'-kinase [Desulfomicrobiaceae bacterium]|nr:tetraacyldisaccharide 4'-kinase [Desulfomicrobiaceae bacterium]
MHPWQRRLSPILLPAGTIYRSLMARRAALYASGRKHSWAPPVPTVSVGNISWGGTGKTPVCSWILDWCERHRLKGAVLTRGYKGKPPALPYPVRPDSPVKHSGDEPLMLARDHPTSRIIVDPDRVRGGIWALEHFRPDLFVLDDGFQHLKVRRDLNLALFSPADLHEDWDRVIPAGTWREGGHALHRADCFLVNTMGSAPETVQCAAEHRLAPYEKKIYLFTVRADGVINVQTREGRSDIGSESYLLVTGIANPDKVVRTAETLLKRSPAEHMTFSDHHAFGEREWAHIRTMSDRLGCRYILCTPKDAIKLQNVADKRLWTFRLNLDFPSMTADGDIFPLWWDKELQQKFHRTISK